MTSRKRNEWLDAASNDEESERDSGSDSEEEKPVFRSTKRRKVAASTGDDESREDELSDSEYKDFREFAGVLEEEDATGLSLRHGDEEDFDARRTEVRQVPKKLQKLKQRIHKSGVVYISRIPPFMKPATLKSYLEPFGEIGRIFLTPEDPTAHTKRVRSGGNKKRSFVDGWAEFASKKDAKACAATLNTEIIGGKKGSWYHDDIWNIKYLKGFKWDHLMEQMKNENAERASRLRAEIAQTTRENKRYLANVERSKMLDGMQKKKALRADTQNEAEPSKFVSGNVTEQSKKHPSHDRTFKQSAIRKKSSMAADGKDKPARPPAARITGIL